MRGSQAVWRALQAARRANLAERGEARPARHVGGETRRNVLKALGALGMASTLPRPARAANERVAIIGGGIAGLTALLRLTEAGVDARLYEARGRLGGRMFTARGFDGVGRLEDGGQLVNSDHEDVRGLAAEFGLSLIDRKIGAHESLVIANGAVVPPARLADALRGIAEQITADADRLDGDFARHAPALDRLSVAAYLDRHAAAIAEPWARSLLEMSCRSEYGVEPGQASALELIFNLPTVKGERAEVLGDSDERYLIAGGSGALIAAMASRFADRIETGKRLARIDPGLRLSFLDGSTASADRVIVAVPAPIMRQIGFGVPLPALWRAFIAEARLGRNEKVHIGCASRPWIELHGLGGEVWHTDAAAGYALGWDGTIGDDAPGVWTGFMGGDQVAAARVSSRRFAEAAAPALPGLAASLTGEVRRTAWHRDPLALGAYSNFAPGQLTRFAPLFWVEDEDARQSAAAGRVIFAGEHLSDAWAGFMNGGAQTGRLAAEAVAGRSLVHARAAA